MDTLPTDDWPRERTLVLRYDPDQEYECVLGLSPRQGPLAVTFGPNKPLPTTHQDDTLLINALRSLVVPLADTEPIENS